MSRHEEHLQVAHSYYVLHQSVAEIAARLSIPVSRVQRLLRESLENGIVQVSIPEWKRVSPPCRPNWSAVLASRRS